MADEDGKTSEEGGDETGEVEDLFQEEPGTEEAGDGEPEETDAVIDTESLGLSEEKEEPEGEDPDEEEEAPPTKPQPAPKPAEAKKPEDAPKWYSEAEFSDAERQLDEQLDDGQITPAQHREYIRRVDKLRRDQELQEYTRSTAEQQQVQAVESNIRMWAEQQFPDALDDDGQVVKDAIEFGVNNLGAKKVGNRWTFPEFTARTLMAVVHAGSKGDTAGGKGAVKAAEERGYKEGVVTSQARRADMQRRGSPPKTSTGKAGKDEPPDAQEKEAMERLDIRDLKTYRAIKKAMKSGATQVGVK